MRVRGHYQYFREGMRGLGQWRSPGRQDEEEEEEGEEEKCRQGKDKCAED